MTFLIEKCTTNDIIAESDRDTSTLVKPSNMWQFEFTNGLWLKALRCIGVYERYVVQEISVEGLLQSIKYSMLSCWSSHKNKTLQRLVNQATLMTKVQTALRQWEQARTYTKSLHRLINLEANRRQSKNYSIGYSSNTAPQRSQSRKEMGAAWYLLEVFCCQSIPSQQLSTHSQKIVLKMSGTVGYAQNCCK